MFSFLKKLFGMTPTAPTAAPYKIEPPVVVVQCVPPDAVLITPCATAVVVKKPRKPRAKKPAAK